MNSYDSLKTYIIVLLFAFYLLWLIIQPFIRDKIIRKVDLRVTLFMLVTLNAINLIQDNFDYLIIIIFSAIYVILIFASQYFQGDKYHINTPSDISLKNSIKAVLIESGEGSGPILTEEPERKVKIEMDGKPNYITIEPARRFPFGDPYEILSFIKWRDSKSKKRILDMLDSRLQQGNKPSKQSKKRFWIKFVFSSLIILSVLIYGNFLLFRDMESTIKYSDAYPNLISITELDQNITDKKEHKTTEIEDPLVIKAVYEKYQNNSKYLMKSVDLDKKIMNFKTVIQLQEPWKSIYTGNQETYLVVDYEVMQQETKMPKILVWLFRVFESDAYSYYHL